MVRVSAIYTVNQVEVAANLLSAQRDLIFERVVCLLLCCASKQILI